MNMQHDFDEMDAITVHLMDRVGDRYYAACTGAEIDPDRWTDSSKPRKQCQACAISAKISARIAELKKLALELVDMYQSAEQSVIDLRGIPRVETPELEAACLALRARIEQV